MKSPQEFSIAAISYLSQNNIFWAVFFHGTFDFLIFLQANEEINKYVSDVLLFGGAVGSYFVVIALSRKHIRLHHQLSQQMFKASQNV